MFTQIFVQLKRIILLNNIIKIAVRLNALQLDKYDQSIILLEANRDAINLAV